MTEIPTNISIVIPVIIGLAKLFGMVGFSRKFIPVLNLILGIAAGIMYIEPSNVKNGILFGLIAGLTSSGLYSSVKNTVQGVKIVTTNIKEGDKGITAKAFFK